MNVREMTSIRYRDVAFLTMICLISCAKDPCVQLCEQTAEQLDSCLQQWPVTWNDLGSDSREGFVDSCRNQWSAERSVLEPRALDDAYEQCEESNTYMPNNSQSCDQLRAIYLLTED